MNRLRVLKLFTADSEYLSVFDEDCPCLHKAKSDIPRYAFFPQCLHPVKITRPRSSVVFSSAGHLFNLAAVKIPAYTDRTQQRSTMQAFMTKRQVQELWDPLVRSALILTGHIQENIVPASPPIGRQAFLYSLGPFRQQQKNDIAPDTHHFPCFGTSFIRFFQEKIRGHADADHFAALDLVFPVFVF